MCSSDLQEIGGKQILKVLSQAAVMGGAPRDFKLESTGEPPQAPDETPQALTPDQVVQLIQGEQQKLTKELVEQVIKPAAEMDAQQERKITGLEGAVVEIGQAVAKLNSIIEAAASAPPLSPPTQYDAIAPTPVGQAYPPEPQAAGGAGNVVDINNPPVV